MLNWVNGIDHCDEMTRRIYDTTRRAWTPFSP